MEKIPPFIHGSSEELNEDHIDAAVDDLDFRMEVMEVASRLRHSTDPKNMETYDLCMQILNSKKQPSDELVQIFKRLRQESEFHNDSPYRIKGETKPSQGTQVRAAKVATEKTMPNPSDLDSDGNPIEPI